MHDEDCCFIRNGHWFRYRTGAIIIENNQMLFVRSKGIPFVYTVGGAVNLGESSLEGVLRETYEETGIRYEIDHLAMIVENFFTGHGGNLNGMDCQCIEFYYLMKSTGNMDVKSTSVNWDDEEEELIWVPLDKIKDYNIRPGFIRDRIDEIIHSKEVIHVITDVDRDH